MERLIAPLTSLDEVQTEFEVKLCEIPEYTGGLDASLQFTIPAAHMENVSVSMCLMMVKQ